MSGCFRGGGFNASVNEALGSVRAALRQVERRPEKGADGVAAAKAELARMREIRDTHRASCEACAPLAITA
jgi:hypothetical protein